MPKIFQQFCLNLEAMIRLDNEALSKLNLPEAGRTLKQELINKGYQVLESNVYFYGVSDSVIVGGEFGKNHKSDFYELTEKLGLTYKSGGFYTQIE